MNTIDTEKNQCIGELHRKRVANAFWNYQVQLEMKEQNMSDYLFKGQNAQESFMNDIDIKRAHSVYPHTKCTEDCKKRGMYTLQNICRTNDAIRDVLIWKF